MAGTLSPGLIDGETESASSGSLGDFRELDVCFERAGGGDVVLPPAVWPPSAADDLWSLPHRTESVRYLRVPWVCQGAGSGGDGEQGGGLRPQRTVEVQERGRGGRWGGAFVEGMA